MGRWGKDVQNAEIVKMIYLKQTMKLTSHIVDDVIFAFRNGNNLFFSLNERVTEREDESPDDIIYVSNNEVSGLLKWYIEQGIDFTLIDCN